MFCDWCSTFVWFLVWVLTGSVKKGGSLLYTVLLKGEESVSNISHYATRKVLYKTLFLGWKVVHCEVKRSEITPEEFYKAGLFEVTLWAWGFCDVSYLRSLLRRRDQWSLRPVVGSKWLFWRTNNTRTPAPPGLPPVVGHSLPWKKGWFEGWISILITWII